MIIKQNELHAADQAVQNPIWVDTSSGLARAAKAWSRQSWLAIDTEFVRERTYYAKLGLVQISDAQTVWLIDIPALNNLDPLAELMANTTINKILHGAGEDLEIFQQRLSVLPTPLFDSQVAAAMLGYSLQLSYEHMINELLPMHLDKGPSRSNWLHRPLTEAQIIYASNDVAYLPLVTRILRHRLEQQNRLDWHQQDMQAIHTQTQRPNNIDKLYLRVKGFGQLNGMGLAWLQRLAIWRDQQAQARDLPRSFVLSDPELVSIATLACQQENITADTIKALDQLHPKSKRRIAESLATCLLDKPEHPLPELAGRPSAKQRRQLTDMQIVVRAAAEQLNIQPALLASKRILQSLQDSYLENNNSPGLNGWRGQLLNSDLQAALNLSA